MYIRKGYGGREKRGPGTCVSDLLFTGGMPTEITLLVIQVAIGNGQGATVIPP